MLKSMELREGVGVFMSDNKQVGKINRFILDPETNEVTHVVVQKGWLLLEMRRDSQTLEDVFKVLTKGDERKDRGRKYEPEDDDDSSSALGAADEGEEDEDEEEDEEGDDAEDEEGDGEGDDEDEEESEEAPLKDEPKKKAKG